MGFMPAQRETSLVQAAFRHFENANEGLVGVTQDNWNDINSVDDKMNITGSFANE